MSQNVMPLIEMLSCFYAVVTQTKPCPYLSHLLIQYSQKYHMYIKNATLCFNMYKPHSFDFLPQETVFYPDPSGRISTGCATSP